MPHLMKYTTAYEDLYPSATQILVQSAPSFFWSFEGTLVGAALVCSNVAKFKDRWRI